MSEIIERKKMSWKVEGTILTVTMVSGKQKSFDMARVTQEAVIDHIYQYGIKQILGDACARKTDEKLDDDGKLTVMAAKFSDMISGDILKTERAAAKDKISKFFTDADIQARIVEMAEIGVTMNYAQVKTLLEKTGLVHKAG